MVGRLKTILSSQTVFRADLYADAAYRAPADILKAFHIMRAFFRVEKILARVAVRIFAAAYGPGGTGVYAYSAISAGKNGTRSDNGDSGISVSTVANLTLEPYSGVISRQLRPIYPSPDSTAAVLCGK